MSPQDKIYISNLNLAPRDLIRGAAGHERVLKQIDVDGYQITPVKGCNGTYAELVERGKVGCVTESFRPYTAMKLARRIVRGESGLFPALSMMALPHMDDHRAVERMRVTAPEMPFLVHPDDQWLDNNVLRTNRPRPAISCAQQEGLMPLILYQPTAEKLFAWSEDYADLAPDDLVELIEEKQRQEQLGKMALDLNLLRMRRTGPLAPGQVDKKDSLHRHEVPQGKREDLVQTFVSTGLVHMVQIGFQPGFAGTPRSEISDAFNGGFFEGEQGRLLQAAREAWLVGCPFIAVLEVLAKDAQAAMPKGQSYKVGLHRLADAIRSCGVR